MAKIINLNEAVGEDVVFQYGNPVVEYAIPGDIDVATVFQLFEAFQNVTKIEGDNAEELTASVKQKFDAITGKLMEVLQVRQPTLKKYPFGIKSTGVVLREILSALGVGVTADPPTPAPRAARRKSASTTRRKTSARRR